MTPEYETSDAFVLKAVPKTDANPYGVVQVDSIELYKPCVIALSGELTDNPRFANHYIKQIRQVLESDGLGDTNLYSIYYHFGSRDTVSERVKLFQRARHRIRNLGQNLQEIAQKIKSMDDNEPSPKYIEKLYKTILEPILAPDSNGPQPTVEKLAKRASYIRFYAHSHGAAVATMLGKYMEVQMRNMGYEWNDIRAVQSNIIVIQHGPITPLERPNFTTLSFASASDTKANFHNRLYEYAFDNSFDLYPSYFGRAGAHVFTAGELSIYATKEHDNDGLLNDEILTPDGCVIFAAQRNAIINSIRYAGQPVPNVRELVSGPGVDFDDMAANGKWFYKLMMSDIKNQIQQNPEHDYQI